MFNSRITSLAFSDLGTYSIDYLANGNIDTITYPNSQGEETYTYGGGKGRLSQIEYPNDDTLEFLWNDKDEVTRLTYTEYTTQTETRYTMTYTPNHEVATLTQSIDSVQQYVWTFTWAPNGLEKAVKTINSQPVLTQDFTTDQSGRILSMTYDTTGEVGYDGELYFHYDHFGNTTLLTDEEGSPVASFEYDLHSGKIINEWNPSGLEVMNLGESNIGSLTFANIDGNIDLSVALSNVNIYSSFCAVITTSSGTDMRNLTDEEVENNCRYECSNEKCEDLFQAQDSSNFKYNDYAADPANCKRIICCLGLYMNSIVDSSPDCDGNVEIDDYSGNPPARMSFLLRESRKSAMSGWYEDNKDKCASNGVYLGSYLKRRAGAGFR